MSSERVVDLSRYRRSVDAAPGPQQHATASETTRQRALADMRAELRRARFKLTTAEGSDDER